MPSTKVSSAGIEVATQTSGTSRRSGLGTYKSYCIFLPLPPTYAIAGIATGRFCDYVQKGHQSGQLSIHPLKEVWERLI